LLDGVFGQAVVNLAALVLRPVLARPVAPGPTPVARAGAVPALTEDFINFPRSLKGTEVALLFREVGPKKYRVSFRSRGKIDVSLVSRVFQGGGHPNAAGCTVAGSLREVRAKVLKQVRAAF